LLSEFSSPQAVERTAHDFPPFTERMIVPS
jgi:hypothetical protein